MGQDTRIGTEIAGYRIESVIGRGGMGVVYRAEHLRLKRKLALKVLAPELATDERFRERFVRESELAASLEHPNIVPIYDAGEADGLLYIAMRFVEGTDLKTEIERQPLRLDRAATIVEQVAAALDTAHAKGLIHRDVKPANVLLDTSDHAYLTDFGLTKRPDQTTGLTRTGQFMGSVDYAAPEQFEGKPLDARTDVYALACVAYECLTGEVPFRRDQEAAVMYAHLRDSPPSPSTNRPELPASVDTALAKGMAKRPEDRYRSCGALASALGGALGPTLPARPLGRPRRFVALASAALAVIVIAVAAGIAVAHSTREPAPTASRSAGVGASGAPVPFNGVIHVDPSTAKETKIPISQTPHAVATGGGYVWLTVLRGTMYKISPQQNTVINSKILEDVGFFPIVAFGDGSVWIAPGHGIPSGGFALSRLDPATLSVEASIPLPPDCCADVVFGDGSVWVLGATELLRVDSQTAKIEATISVGGTYLAFAGGKVWVLDGILGRLLPIDPATDRAGRPQPLVGNPIAIAGTSDAIWVTDEGGTVSRIPIAGTSGIDTIHVGATATGIAAGVGSVWVTDTTDGTVSRIDPEGGPAQSIHVGGHPKAIAAGEGGVWIVIES